MDEIINGGRFAEHRLVHAGESAGVVEVVPRASGPVETPTQHDVSGHRSMQVVEVFAYYVRALVGVPRTDRSTSACPVELIHDPIPDLDLPRVIGRNKPYRLKLPTAPAA
jgi:hypothetical protein